MEYFVNKWGRFIVEYLSTVIYENEVNHENTATTCVSASKEPEVPQSIVCIFKSATGAKDGTQVFRSFCQAVSSKQPREKISNMRSKVEAVGQLWSNGVSRLHAS